VIYKDMPNEEYHKVDNKNFSVSSSQLKKMLEDPEVFYKTYITKETEKETSSAMDVGTFFHTSVLEPSKMVQECAVYYGVRKGEKWETFKTENAGKTIITGTEYEGAKRMIDAIQASKKSLELLSNGVAEISCFETVYVGEFDIMVKTDKGNLILGKGGWEVTERNIPDTYVPITCKVRADYLREKEGDISDLKSCSGNTKDKVDIQRRVSNYEYAMSAAFYLDIFSLGFNRPFMKFNWIFASKDMGNCQPYLASPKNIQVGRAKWSKAIKDLAKYVKNGWKFEEEVIVLGPQFFETEWINNKGEDVL